MGQWYFFVLYYHLTLKKILWWFTLYWENVVDSIHLAFSYLCFLLTFLAGWSSHQDTGVYLPYLRKTLYTDILGSVKQKETDPSWPLHFFPPLPDTLEQLAEFDVDWKWQELKKQHKDFGENRLRPVQPWDTSARCFFQVPTGLGFIKNKSQLPSFPLSPPIKSMGSLKENQKTGTFPYSSLHIEKSNSLTQKVKTMPKHTVHLR